MKIEHVEPQFAQKLDSPLKRVLQELQFLLPDNYSPRVSLLDASGRKKRSNASADNWSPESGRIEIRFEPTPLGQLKATAVNSNGKIEDLGKSRNDPKKLADSPPLAKSATGEAGPELLRRLVKALDLAEVKPGWKFVSLKKFRDEVLTSEAFPPSGFQPSDVHWQAALHLAIEKRLVLLGRVPNPKAPEFPVTTIRVNRLLPEVKTILGGGEADLEFRPVEIKGEPLSATVMRERHR